MPKIEKANTDLLTNRQTLTLFWLHRQIRNI